MPPAPMGNMPPIGLNGSMPPFPPIRPPPSINSNGMGPSRPGIGASAGSGGQGGLAPGIHPDRLRMMGN